MLTAEQMHDAMPDLKSGEFTANLGDDNKEDPKECAFMGLIKNQMIVLEEQYAQAKDTFATAKLNDKYSPASYEAELNCRLIEAKIDILTKLQKDFECMLSPVMTPV